MNKLKRYLLLQVTGWGLLALANILFAIFYKNFSNEFLLRLGIFLVPVILSSHIIKIVIGRSGVLRKGIFLQIVTAALITLSFALIAGAVIFLTHKNFNMLSAQEQKVSELIAILTAAFSSGIYLSIWVCCYLIYHYIEDIRKAGEEKLEVKEQMLDLEAKALRAQMNPHFIFNCLNSIKSLIQEGKNNLSVEYLTTFSKLIRTLFANADKKEISLFDELETCKLYLKLEAMRFEEKFSYEVNVDPTLDLRSIQVPSLIIQPFIENAILHGIMPKDAEGQLQVSIEKKEDAINITVDDNGIGREASVQGRSLIGRVHQSKGVFLTQSRLALNNLVTRQEATMEIIDKKSETGVAQGTRAILTFKNKLS